MKTSVLVTAVSGSGKSTVCEALQDLGYNAIDIESVSGLYELVDEKTGKVLPGDLEQISDGVDWNCNKTKLIELMSAQTTDLAFYCGGMSNTDDIWDAFKSVIILIASDRTTQKRLLTRKAGEFGSTQENRDWVLSWKHDLEDRWLKMGGIQINAEHDPNKVAKAIILSARP